MGEQAMQCDQCGGAQFTKAGKDRAGRQQYRCRTCRHRLTARTASAFCGFQFPDDVIALAVRWYLWLRVPYADVATLLAERGVHVDRSTIFDWVQRFAPLYMDAARRKRQPVGHRWSVDETYVKVAGVWRYVYRALDEDGQVVDVLLRERRDTEAAVAFFEQALETTGARPTVVTTDKAAAYPPALAQVLPEAEHVTGKLEQQRIERDHGHLKSRLRSMRWFKTLATAALFSRVHGFLRNLLQGFYELGIVLGDPRRPQAPRLMRAWAELTHVLQAA
jgi:transposase, IS6 family